MTSGPSMLSLLASGAYGLTVLACLAAAVTAVRGRQVPSHWRTWLFLALLFVVLVAWRIFAVEEFVRGYLREILKADGVYNERRSWQAPVVAAIISLAGAAWLLLVYRLTRNFRGRRNKARVVAIVAAFFLLALIALRLISLHAVDALLYGAIKLNWIVDLGASFTVLVAGVYYVRLVRVRP